MIKEVTGEVPEVPEVIEEVPGEASDTEVTDVDDVTTKEQTQKERFEIDLNEAVGTIDDDEAMWKYMRKALKTATETALKAKEAQETTRKYAAAAARSVRFRGVLTWQLNKRKADRQEVVLNAEHTPEKITSVVSDWKQVMEEHPHLTEAKVLAAMRDMVKNEECIMKPKKKKSRSGSE